MRTKKDKTENRKGEHNAREKRNLEEKLKEVKRKRYMIDETSEREREREDRRRVMVKHSETKLERERESCEKRK